MIWLKFILIVTNEFIVLVVILTSNLGEIAGIGVIMNFSAALIVSQVDDFMMKTTVIGEIKEYFTKIEE